MLDMLHDILLDITVGNVFYSANVASDKTSEK